MNNNIFTQVKKISFVHFMLPAFMVLSLLLQNAAYVQHAFASEVESNTTVSVADTVTTEDTNPPAPVISESAQSPEVVGVEEQSSLEDTSELSSEESAEDEDNAEESDDPENNVNTLRMFATGVNTAKPSVTISATKVVCDDEAKLPNWGLGGADINAHTATDYVVAHTGCSVVPDWKFQWGFSGVKDMGGSFVGAADGSKGIGSNTGSGSTDWKTFGPTDTSGVASAVIYDLEGSSRIWVREILKDGFVPFTFDAAHPTNDNAVSAEMYCHADVLNYDNYDYVGSPILGSTYHCVAFNVLKALPPPPVSPSCPFTAGTSTYVVTYGTEKKIISSGTHAEANITRDINIPVGTYEVSLFSYDTGANRATESEPREQWYLRLHNGTTLVTTSNAITDLADNASSASLQQYVGDVTIKTPVTMVMAKHAAWPDTTSSNGLFPICAQLKLKQATNQPPVITVIGANPVSVTENTIYDDLGANALDPEDGDITVKVVKTGTVNTAIVGTYTITYNATDSQSLAAAPKTRVVNVIKAGCTVDCIPNTPPVITVVGTNPVNVTIGTAYADLGATAFDTEDGPITPTATGTVNTAVLGVYTITYSAIDSKGATATPKTRIVNVVPVVVGNQKPEITLLGDALMQLVVGSTFTDPSATVSDPEEGNITNKLVATGTVNTGVIGSYTIIYNATDSQNLAADTRTRTVNVVAAPVTGCTSNCGGGSSTFDYFGCTDRSATNYNSLANKNDGSCRYPGGGGGGGSVPLSISNEKLEVTGTTAVTVTWNTNLPSDSRVVYGMAAVSPLGVMPSYGYPLTTATDTTSVYNHTVVINGIPSAISTYYRPVSSITSETVTGVELTRAAVVAPTAPQSCEYLKEYMRIGTNNNPTEVTKLQTFLRDYDNADTLQVTGFFDVTTDKAVRSFQDKYKKDVLEAWNLPSNTGYVYYTTKKKINEIYCQREFPLSVEQATEIASFRSLIERINAVPSSTGTEVLPLVGTNNTQGSGSAGSVAGASTVKKTPVTVSVTPVVESNGDRSADFAALDAEVKQAVEKDAQDPINRGRIAIADLLATAPSNAEDVTTPEAMSDNDTVGNADEDAINSESGVALGTSTKRNLLASVVNSFSSRINQCSPVTIYFTLTFLILALIFATLYFRKTAEIKVASEAPDAE